MTGLRKSVLAVLFLTLAVPAAALVGPERSDDLTARLNRIFAEAYPATGPGAAVIVVQDEKPILRKGYGLANVELSVPITPEMVFRIGSVTKQFTAAAILKLVEAGKLSLSDSEVFASASSVDSFFYCDHVRDLRFEKTATGEVTALLIDEHIGPIERAVRAKEPLPEKAVSPRSR